MVIGEVVLVFHVAGDGEVDVVVATAGVRTVLRFRPENTAVAVEVVGLDEPRNMFVITIIDKELSVVLVFGDVQFRDLVVVEGGEMVEMFLIEVEQHGVVGRAVDEFELVGGKFSHYHRLFGHLLDDVEEGNADVAGENGVAACAFEKMVDERGCGAFSLGACDADDLFVISLQKEVRLRGDALNFHEIVEAREADARGFENQVIFVETVVVARTRDELQFFVLEFIRFEVGVPICHGYGHFGKILADESVGGDTFFAKSEYDDFLILDGIDDIVGG